ARLLPALASHRASKRRLVARRRARCRAARLLRHATRPARGHRRRACPRGTQCASLPHAPGALAQRAVSSALLILEAVGAVAQRSGRAAYISDVGGASHTVRATGVYSTPVEY